jgi:hypothetical protein
VEEPPSSLDGRLLPLIPPSFSHSSNRLFFLLPPLIPIFFARVLPQPSAILTIPSVFPIILPQVLYISLNKTRGLEASLFSFLSLMFVGIWLLNLLQLGAI